MVPSHGGPSRGGVGGNHQGGGSGAGGEEFRRLVEDVPPQSGVDAFPYPYRRRKEGGEPAEDLLSLGGGPPSGVAVDDNGLPVLRDGELSARTDDLPDGEPPVLQEDGLDRRAGEIVAEGGKGSHDPTSPARRVPGRRSGNC
ncbi:hypothetical protein SDC9_55573 [bioreactor metagenome]|uniref:Uncharacterized protein n=1 Tax=bioreactor metagenome TaxID=1076179 RepID=A0A644WZW7_9ZZZZ